MLARFNLSSGETLTGSEILQNPGLENIGLKYLVDPGRLLVVDESLCVAGPGSWLSAAGGVNGRALLTYASKCHSRIASNDLLLAQKEVDITSNEDRGIFSSSRPRFGAGCFADLLHATIAAILGETMIQQLCSRDSGVP